MKRKVFATVCVLSAIMAGGAAGASGGAVSDGVKERPAIGCPGPGGGPAPHPVDEVLGMMTCRLSLTGEQQEKIKALLLQERQMCEPLLKKRDEAGRKLRLADTGAKFDEAGFRRMAARKAEAEVELSVVRARIRSRINALLTPEQRLRAEHRVPPPHPGPDFAPPPDAGAAPCHMPPPPCGGRWHHPGFSDDGE